MAGEIHSLVVLGEGVKIQLKEQERKPEIFKGSWVTAALLSRILMD